MSENKAERRKAHARARQAKSVRKKRAGFDVAYGTDPAMACHGLSSIGPLFNVAWGPSSVVEQAMISNGQTPPPPIAGQILVDTGADATCISQNVVDALGLKPSGQSQTFGVHGSQAANLYTAKLYMKINDQGEETEIFFERSAIAIPNLGQHFHPTARWNGRPINLVGLLGRDFLSLVTMTYDGPKGKFRIEVHLDKMEQR